MEKQDTNKNNNNKETNAMKKVKQDTNDNNKETNAMKRVKQDTHNNNNKETNTMERVKQVTNDNNNNKTNAMEDLRNIAYAYYEVAKNKKGYDYEKIVLDFSNQMDKKGNKEIPYDVFRLHMNAANLSKFGSDEDFFKKLTRGGRDYLEYCDIVTLLYIVNSGRPFCDKCYYFIPGTFLTCVKCFEKEKDYHYNLCTSCYFKFGINGHCHEKFVDPVTLLRLKAKIESNESSQPKLKPIVSSTIPNMIQANISVTSSVSFSSNNNESRPSSSNAIVMQIPRNRHPRIEKAVVALNLMEFGVGTISFAAAAVAQLCTIM